MEKVLIVGSATSREYALVREFSVSTRCEVSAYLWRDSYFINELCTNYEVGDIRDVNRIITFIKKVKPSFVLILQGEAIQTGIRNHLDLLNIPCIAPTKDQSRLENSKSFCRKFIREINKDLVPRYKVFDLKNISELIDYVVDLKSKKVVLKFDGLINSRGVKIFDLSKDSKNSLYNQAKFWVNEANGKVIVEEYINGNEVSLMSLVDGSNIIHMPPVKNYKRIYDGDLGDNTSGIGSVTQGNTESFLSKNDISKLEKINNLMFEKIKKDFPERYVGVLMGEFIITDENIKVIEYNTRFGNPSTINILNLLNTDFLEICKSMVDGTLNQLSIEWKNLASVSVSIVPKGYPYLKDNIGKKINIKRLNKKDLDCVFFGSLIVDSKKDILLMDSRNLTVCVTGKKINDCVVKIKKILDKIQGPIYFRKDIGVF